MFWLILLVIFAIPFGYIYVLRVKLRQASEINRCSKHLVGKVAIVTGSNVGIGYETAKDFADRGAKVILACRNEQRGLKARDDIIKATGNKDVHYLKLDLSSFKSVREFAEHVIKNEKRLDILVNNAGEVDIEAKQTEDGMLLGMQVNYFGPFLLTNLLLPLLKSSAPSRIVNVASEAYKMGLSLQELNKAPSWFYGKMGVYSKAKLATILSTTQLSRRLEGTGVTANSLCPGFVDTNILRKGDNNHLWKKLFTSMYFLAKDWWIGAQTQIYLSVSPEVADVSGHFFTQCRKRDIEDYAKNPEAAKKLWEESERLVKLNDTEDKKRD